MRLDNQLQDEELPWIAKRAGHLELVDPVVSNEERIEIPKKRHHRQQEYVERGRSLNHQQSRKLLGLRDMVSSTFANTNNWCLLISKR